MDWSLETREESLCPVSARDKVFVCGEYARVASHVAWIPAVLPWLGYKLLMLPQVCCNLEPGLNARSLL